MVFVPTVKINGKYVPISEIPSEEVDKVEELVANRPLMVANNATGSRHGVYKDLNKRRSYMRELMRRKRLGISKGSNGQQARKAEVPF